MASHHEILKQNRRARRKRHFRQLVTVAVIALPVLLFGSWYFWNSPTFALTRVVIAGDKAIGAARLTATVNNVLTGQYLKFFSRRVNWFYPRATLLATLKREFPELAAIKITNPPWGTLRVLVEERQPAAIWCQDISCYFLDRTGLLYSPAPQFSNDPFLTLTGAALPMPIGSRPLATTQFEGLLDLQATINQLLQSSPDFAGQTLSAVSLIEPVDYIFTVRNRRLESSGWKLLASRREPIFSTASRLAATFGAPAFRTEYHLASTTLESLDVRFKRKVFYKFM